MQCKNTKVFSYMSKRKKDLNCWFLPTFPLILNIARNKYLMDKL